MGVDDKYAGRLGNIRGTAFGYKHCLCKIWLSRELCLLIRVTVCQLVKKIGLNPLSAKSHYSGPKGYIFESLKK